MSFWWSNLHLLNREGFTCLPGNSSLAFNNLKDKNNNKKKEDVLCGSLKIILVQPSEKIKEALLAFGKNPRSEIHNFNTKV